MNTRWVAYASLFCLTFTGFWLILLLISLVGAGALETFDQTLAYVSRSGPLWYLTYINAVLVTLCVTVLFNMLYEVYRPVAPYWAAFGVIFVPIYTILNLIAYLSQLTLVPQLLRLSVVPATETLAIDWLRQILQIWPYSTVAMVNSLAYAVLGLPALVFGSCLLRSGGELRAGGLFLILNGVTCTLGFAGAVSQVRWLSQGTVVGGLFFLIALGLLYRGFFLAGYGPLRVIAAAS